MAEGKLTRRRFLKAAGVTAVGLPIVFALNESFAVELSGLERQRAKPKPFVRAVFVRLPTPWWMVWPGAAYPVVLITAHCTCPLKLEDFTAKPAPFILWSHAESNTGVAMQVLWEVGKRVTVTRFLGPNNLMAGTGIVVENLNTPPWGGCRTSVAVKLDDAPDIRKLRGFHHQVLVLGDHVELLRCFAQLHGVTPLTVTAAAELIRERYASGALDSSCC